MIKNDESLRDCKCNGRVGFVNFGLTNRIAVTCRDCLTTTQKFSNLEDATKAWNERKDLELTEGFNTSYAATCCEEGSNTLLFTKESNKTFMTIYSQEHEEDPLGFSHTSSIIVNYCPFCGKQCSEKDNK